MATPVDAVTTPATQTTGAASALPVALDKNVDKAKLLAIIDELRASVGSGESLALTMMMIMDSSLITRDDVLGLTVHVM
ncbi:hypothetical protein PINS_up002563 [Pythium insidiosum]|nr:hypothetical protein PINS_up002563 [Pythium insidiosum]